MKGPRWSLRARSESAEQTRLIGAALAHLCHAGDVILLTGSLGAGKTVFAQGFAGALGIVGPVTSPTFTLVRQYRCSGPGPIRQLIHADLYRLDQPGEVADLALSELVEEGGVALVEWGERGARDLGHNVLEVGLSLPDAPPDEVLEKTRVVTISGLGPDVFDRHDAIAGALGHSGVLVLEAQ